MRNSNMILKGPVLSPHRPVLVLSLLNLCFHDVLLAYSASCKEENCGLWDYHAVCVCVSVCLAFQLLKRLTEAMKRGVGVACLAKIRKPYSKFFCSHTVNRIDERIFFFWVGLTILPLRILKLYNAIDLRKTRNLKWQYGGLAIFF